MNSKISSKTKAAWKIRVNMFLNIKKNWGNKMWQTKTNFRITRKNDTKCKRRIEKYSAKSREIETTRNRTK